MSTTNTNQQPQLSLEEKAKIASAYMDREIFMRKFFEDLHEKTGWYPESEEQAIRIRQATMNVKSAWYQQQLQQVPQKQQLSELVLQGVEKLAGLSPKAYQQQQYQQQQDQAMMQKVAELAANPNISACINVVKPILEKQVQ